VPAARPAEPRGAAAGDGWRGAVPGLSGSELYNGCLPPRRRGMAGQVTQAASAMTPRVEFFFDCSSPWTWLAFHNMQVLAAEMAVAVDFRPVLLGAIFNAVNPDVYAFRETGAAAKKRYIEKDLQDW